MQGYFFRSGQADAVEHAPAAFYQSHLYLVHACCQPVGRKIYLPFQRGSGFLAGEELVCRLSFQLFFHTMSVYFYPQHWILGCTGSTEVHGQPAGSAGFYFIQLKINDWEMPWMKTGPVTSSAPVVFGAGQDIRPVFMRLGIAYGIVFHSRKINQEVFIVIGR